MPNSYDDLISKGKPLLREYLTEHDVEFVRRGSTEFFSCINPEHADENPSAGFVKGSDDTQFHCFSCSCSGDVYTAAAYLEGKPLYGLNFIRNNVEALLTKYQVEYDSPELSEVQLNEIKYDSVYQAAYQLLTTKDSSKFTHISLTHAKKRGWKEEICRRIGIGEVKNFRDFINSLATKTMLSHTELEYMGIRPQLFGPKLLTFCIRDHQGNIKGFVARYIPWKKGSAEPKYRNTSIDDNPFYRKDKLLFGLNTAKRLNSLRLDIFEGYGSMVTAQQEGHRNCVAIGGTALTDQHVELILNLGFSHINLVLDQDITGNERMDKYIEKFSGYSGLTVSTTHLPLSDDDLKGEGNNDPDYFIQKYGITSYRAIKPMGVFEHLLTKQTANLAAGSPEAVAFCRNMTKLLINEDSLIERGQMINTLARRTGVSKDDIRDEISKIEATNVRQLSETISRDLRNVKHPDDLQVVLDRARTKLEDSSSTKKDRHLISVEETLGTFDDIFQEMNQQLVGVHGWITGFEAFDNMLDGIQRPSNGGGVAIGFAGAPQHAKSAILLNLSLRVALKNKDASVLYWAIDDNRKAIAYRLIAMISGVSIKKVRKLRPRTSGDEKLILDAQKVLRELISQNRLVFKDDRLGRATSRAESWIKSTQDITGNDILLCVDSLHNISTNVDAGNERVGVKRVSSWLKGLCTTVPCSVLATLELNKNRNEAKPNLTSIMESGKIEFDFDTIAIVWHEAQGSYTAVENVAAKWGGPGNWKPIIELDIQKNKTSAGEKGSLFFKFDSDTTALIDCKTVLDIPNSTIEKNINGTNFTYSNSSTQPVKGDAF